MAKVMEHLEEHDVMDDVCETAFHRSLELLQSGFRGLGFNGLGLRGLWV